MVEGCPQKQVLSQSCTLTCHSKAYMTHRPRSITKARPKLVTHRMFDSTNTKVFTEEAARTRSKHRRTRPPRTRSYKGNTRRSHVFAFLFRTERAFGRSFLRNILNLWLLSIAKATLNHTWNEMQQNTNILYRVSDNKYAKVKCCSPRLLYLYVASQKICEIKKKIFLIVLANL